jgi:uncharacterized protein (TIGR02246 family)
MRGFKALVMLLALTGWARAQEMNADEKAIRDLPPRYSDVWNKADAKGVAGLFAPDGDLVGAAGETMKGRDGVEKGVAGELAGLYKGSKSSNTTTSVRFLSADIAVADGTWQFSGMHGPDGKEMTADGLWTAVLVKKDGTWWISALRAMHPLPAPGPAPK